MTASMTRYAGPISQAEVHAHGLVASGFAEDQALAEVLDRYPAELFDINLYDYDDEGQVSLRTGARGRLNGAELLEAIQQSDTEAGREILAWAGQHFNPELFDCRAANAAVQRICNNFWG